MLEIKPLKSERVKILTTVFTESILTISFYANEWFTCSSLGKGVREDFRVVVNEAWEEENHKGSNLPLFPLYIYSKLPLVRNDRGASTPELSVHL